MVAFSSVVIHLQEENYLNKSDTDVEFDILFIASPTNWEIVKISIFFAPFTRSELLIVSVIINLFIFEFLIFSTAYPLRTPWVT